MITEKKWQAMVAENQRLLSEVNRTRAVIKDLGIKLVLNGFDLEVLPDDVTQCMSKMKSELTREFIQDLSQRKQNHTRDKLLATNEEDYGNALMYHSAECTIENVIALLSGRLADD